MSQGNKLALIVACDRYADPELKQLQAPPEDAETLQRILEDPKIGGFKVTSFINQPYWIIKEKIDEFLQSCNREDTILLYFSCHGIKDKNGQLYFATINTNRRQLFSTAIESTFVNNMLDECRAQQKLVLLDCCYSGAFEKGRVVRADKQVNATEFFGRGNVVITASDSMQYAFEGDDKIESLRKGSYFTSALIEGLETGKADVNSDGRITYSELYAYVHDYVKRITPDQTPTLNTRGVQGDFAIFKNPNLISEKPDVHIKPPRLHRRKLITIILATVSAAIVVLFLVVFYDAPPIAAAGTNKTVDVGSLVALDGRSSRDPDTSGRIVSYQWQQTSGSPAIALSNRNMAISSFIAPEVQSTTEFTFELAVTDERGNTARDDVRITVRPIDSSGLIMEGINLAESGRYEQAIEYYDRVPFTDPDYDDAVYFKAVSLRNLGRYEEAIESYDRALAINSSDVDALNGKGLALFFLGRYEEAIEIHDRALAINPNSEDPLFFKAISLSNLGRYEEAIESYDRALAINSSDVDALNGKGRALYSLGRYEEAIVSYDRALAINPKYEFASYNKGLALSNLGRYEEAIVSYDRALAINSSDPYFSKDKAIALSHLGRYEEAIVSYDRALAINPNFGDALNDKGNALSNLGRYEEAIVSYDRALAINSSDVYALNNKGNALSNLGRYEEAISSFEEVLTIDPSNNHALEGKRIAISKL